MLPGARAETRVALGAGCITGKITRPKGSDWSVLERPAEVTAVMKGSRTHVRRTRCDDVGHFCVRYLSRGTYSLFINDPKIGFCRVDDIAVPAGVVNVGERTLAAGATVNVAIHFLRPTPPPDNVVADGPPGASVRRAFSLDSSCDQVNLVGLWPGHWTVSAQRGDEVVAKGKVDATESGTFNVVLRSGNPEGM